MEFIISIISSGICSAARLRRRCPALYMQFSALLDAHKILYLQLQISLILINMHFGLHLRIRAAAC